MRRQGRRRRPCALGLRDEHARSAKRSKACHGDMNAPPRQRLRRHCRASAFILSVMSSGHVSGVCIRSCTRIRPPVNHCLGALRLLLASSFVKSLLTQNDSFPPSCFQAVHSIITKNFTHFASLRHSPVCFSLYQPLPLGYVTHAG